MSEYILEAKGIVKIFPGVRALDGVDLKVKREKYMPLWEKTVRVRVL